MSVILSAAKRSRRIPDRLLKSPHPTLLPQGEGTAVSRNDRDLRRTSLLSLSLPLGETHAQAAVRAAFQDLSRAGRSRQALHNQVVRMVDHFAQLGF